MTSFLIANIEHALIGDAEGGRFSGAIRVKDGVISEMGDLAAAPGEDIVDASGCVVTPGLVNTHHHLFQSALKAVPDGLNQGLDIWLQKVPYAFWPFIDEDALRVSARIGLAELALSGCTATADHHYVFNETQDYDPAEILFEEAERFGMRFVLARGGGTKGRDYFDDPSLPPSFKETLETYLSRLEASANRWHDPSPHSMRRVAAAPTTPTFNVEPHELSEIANAARSKGLRLHSHLSENTTYVDYALRNHSKRPVPWLADLGWLGEDVWFAHLVELDDREVAMLAETGTAMAHCTQANARLGSGVAPADKLHSQGGVVSIGVDGAGANEAADMGAALYAAFTTHRATKGAAATRAETVLHWTTAGGARCLGFDRIGQLRPGMAADIVLFELTHPRCFGLHDLATAPVTTGATQVRASFVGGRRIVDGGKLPWLDLGDLAADAARVVQRLIAKRNEALAR